MGTGLAHSSRRLAAAQARGAGTCARLNLIVGEHGWAFIDWDLAAPGRLLWDLALPVCTFVPLDLELAAALQAVVKLDNEDRHNRHGYLRLVAAAGDDGVPKAELVNGHFQGNGRGYGGTRSSVEKTWQSSGGKAFAKQLIYRRADGRLIMFAPARHLVLDLIGG